MRQRQRRIQGIAARKTAIGKYPSGHQAGISSVDSHATVKLQWKVGVFFPVVVRIVVSQVVIVAKPAEGSERMCYACAENKIHT